MPQLCTFSLSTFKHLSTSKRRLCQETSDLLQSGVVAVWDH